MHPLCLELFLPVGNDSDHIPLEVQIPQIFQGAPAHHVSVQIQDSVGLRRQSRRYQEAVEKSRDSIGKKQRFETPVIDPVNFHRAVRNACQLCKLFLFKIGHLIDKEMEADVHIPVMAAHRQGCNAHMRNIILCSRKSNMKSILRDRPSQVNGIDDRMKKGISHISFPRVP